MWLSGFSNWKMISRQGSIVCYFPIAFAFINDIIAVNCHLKETVIWKIIWIYINKNIKITQIKNIQNI